MSRNINLKKKTVVIVLVIIAILCLVIPFGGRNGSFRDFLGKVGYAYQRCGNSQGVFAFYNVHQILLLEFRNPPVYFRMFGIVFLYQFHFPLNGLY